MNILADKTWHAFMAWLAFAVSLTLICGAAVIMAMPLDTGPGILPLPVEEYVAVVSFMAAVLLGTIWFLREYAIVTGSVLMLLSALTLVWSLSLVKSVTESNVYTWPTPGPNRMASLATAIMLLIVGIMCVAKPKHIKRPSLE